MKPNFKSAVLLVLLLLPVVFHNLSGYDAHLFIRELGRHSRDTMEVIAKNKEDYISFSVEVAVDKYVDKLGNEKDKLIELRFIDSFKFMANKFGFSDQKASWW